MTLERMASETQDKLRQRLQKNDQKDDNEDGQQQVSKQQSGDSAGIRLQVVEHPVGLPQDRREEEDRNKVVHPDKEDKDKDKEEQEYPRYPSLRPSEVGC